MPSEPFGIPNKLGSDAADSLKDEIVNRIKRLVANYGLSGNDWENVISSQYFLLPLSKMLNWNQADYERLLNCSLANFKLTYSGDYELDDGSILITPDETERIMRCMREEDEKDGAYMRFPRMRAENIDSAQMYMNYHYGLLLRIVSFEETGVLKALRHQCLDRLLDESALDPSGGWYPYRVPWLTARILISLKEVDCEEYDDRDGLKIAIDKSLNSLLMRIDPDVPIWQSGVGSWVSKWESTALCLEALLVWDAASASSQGVRKIVDYLLREDVRKAWLGLKCGFDDEEQANDTLSSTMLSSVLLMAMRCGCIVTESSRIERELLEFIDSVLLELTKAKEDHYRQFCTIPQILYYSLKAASAEGSNGNLE